MESLFTRTYRYRQRENKNELENFSTEIFAYCLEKDEQFRSKFLEILNLEPDSSFHISTQQQYENIGRPDIEIVGDKFHIIIECKIDSYERPNQLADYLKIFQKKKNRPRHLIYLTKYFEHKSVDKKDVDYSNLTWVDINQIAEQSDKQITQEFGLFLKEKNIAMEKNFNSLDILTLENISNTMAKMNEVLDSVKEHFSKSFGIPSKDSARSTQLNWSAFYNYKHIGDPRKFTIDVGFQWWFEEATIFLTIRIFLPTNSPSVDELNKFFTTELEPLDWEMTKEESGKAFGKYLNVNEVIATEDEHIPKMIEFLTGRIDELVEIKKKNPKLFK